MAFRNGYEYELLHARIEERIMELKTKYQYTYFIYPFVIKEEKYQRYLLSLLKDKQISLKLFSKEKDLRLYQYFLPKTSEFLFSSFGLSLAKAKKLEELPDETKAAILSKNPCTIFTYNLKQDIQGKTEEKGIFFRLSQIEIICFRTGICFLVMKTHIEGSDSFSDVLNFNYKFRMIPQDFAQFGNNDNIHLQTDRFENMEELRDFVQTITGSSAETMKLNIDTQRFLTYSYVCIDQRSWNEQKEFENIESQFTKFANFLPVDNHINYGQEEAVTFSKWTYAKFGIAKQGVTLFASDADMNNYTLLPDQFENEYFYTYLINVYKKLFLKKIEQEFRKGARLPKTRKQFIEFTKTLWIEEVTEEEVGSCLNHLFCQTMNLDRLYLEMKNQYDVLYKESNIQKNTKALLVLTIVLVIALIVNLAIYL